MKYLICGLGNPGAEYRNTRHNIGFEVIDQLASSKDATFEEVRHGWMTKIKHKGRTLLLLKPSTYMNLSGKAVRYWKNEEKIQDENLLVIVDDLHLPFGSVRMRKNGAHGGHNGLRDIEDCLGHQYPRMRIGIGSDFHAGQQVDHVLGEWTEEERKRLPDILDHVERSVLSYSSIGISRAMNEANKKL